ncbi:MAG: ABC transporter permease [Anaerolineae bacterium]|nr:ABC transporter permease [Anaerolineae bacterium]
MTRLQTVWRKIWGSYSIGLAVLIVGLLVALLTPNFLRVDNLLNVLTNASVVGIVGLGMTLAIASGMFDLSVGSTAAFAGCVTLSLVPEYGVLPSVLAGLASGALIGLCNGLVITELRVPAFIATMAMMTIVRGAALIFTDGRDVYLFGYPDYKVLTRRVFDAVPMPVILVLVILVLLILMINHTRFGRHILAVGSNLTATKRAGVRTSLVIWGVFAIVGVTAALTGLIVSAQVLTANARLNFGLELSAIAVVVIGGTALDGGRANPIGTLLGSLLVAIINNGLNLLNVPIFYQQLTVGLLLLAALALSVRQGFSPTAYLRRQA